jgi:hypothetical protein
MTPLTTVKMALAMVAAILLGMGIRTDSSPLRVAGIAFLVVAFGLRFVRKDRSE